MHKYELNLEKKKMDWDILKLGFVSLILIAVYSFC